MLNIFPKVRVMLVQKHTRSGGGRREGTQTKDKARRLDIKRQFPPFRVWGYFTCIQSSIIRIRASKDASQPVSNRSVSRRSPSPRSEVGPLDSPCCEPARSAAP